jgi:hypothetical protein
MPDGTIRNNENEYFQQSTKFFCNVEKSVYKTFVRKNFQSNDSIEIILLTVINNQNIRLLPNDILL